MNGQRLRVMTLSDDERASLAVELGLMLPVIVLLISGAIWFGLMFSTQLNLTQASREAVRVYALTGDPGQAAATANAAYAGSAANVFDDAGLLSGGSCDPVNPGTPPPNAYVRVSTTFNFNPGFMPFGSVDLDSEAVMRCGG